MASKKQDPWSLVLDRRFSEAARMYEDSLKVNPDDAGALGGHATVMLCLGKLSAALDEFRLANKAEAEDLRDIGGKSQPYLTKIGTVLWLLGRREEAVATFRSGVQGIEDGSIEFGDNAGGATHGLLLWYAAMSVKDQASCHTAIKFLRNIAASKKIKLWPGPLAAFVVLDASENDLLLQVSRGADLPTTVELAKSDLLLRRRLSRAFFYIGARKRAEGAESKCHDWMLRCAGMENPILEVEWYIARGEVAPY